MIQGIGYKEIVEGLIMLGVKKRDTVLVHSSLRAFGYVDGGSDTIVRALLDCIGNEGNLIMPTLSFSSVNEESPFFDVEETIYKERDAIREAQIGAARCMRISARDNIRIGCETLVHNYRYILD